MLAFVRASTGTWFGRAELRGIALVRDAGQERIALHGTSHGAINFDADVRVRVLRWIGADAVANALSEGVAVGQAALFLVADAAVEIILMTGVGPEGGEPRGEQIVDKLGDRAVDFLHHWAEVLA